jgi:hypothetical protein
MSNQLANARYKEPVTEYAGVSGYAFDKGTGRMVVQIIWSTDGTDQVVDVPAGFVGAYDKYGTALTSDAGQLAVGWSPIYVELEQDTTE